VCGSCQVCVQGLPLILWLPQKTVGEEGHGDSFAPSCMLVV
jgi:hypothetical protein